MKALYAMLALLIVAGTALAEGGEGFKKSYAEAEKAAKAENKPMFLQFSTNWCGWCRKLEKDTFPDPKVKETFSKFVTAYLDCTVEQGEKPTADAKLNLDMMAKLGGRGYPFMAIIDVDGTVLNIISGYMKPAEFLKELQKGLDTQTEYREFQAMAAKADKNGYDYNVKAMKLFAKTSKMDQAVAAAKAVRTLDPKDEKGNNIEATFVLLKDSWAKNNDTEAAVLIAEIKKADPKNEKGMLEKVMMQQAERLTSRQVKSAEEWKKVTSEALAVLEELTGTGVKLQNGQEIYANQGILYLMGGQKDKGLASLEKALAIDPKGEQAEQIKAMIAKVKASASKPANGAATKPAEALEAE